MLGEWIEHPVWRFLASVRLLIGLLIFFVLICVGGALVPQDLKPQEILLRYGPVKGVLLERVGLTDIFRSWFFALLLVTLSLNVIACTTRRLVLKAMRGTRLVGYLLLHLGLIVIFVGGTASALGGEKGFLQVWEEKSSSRFWSWKESAFKELPFTVALDRFTVQRYEEYKPATIFAEIHEESYSREFPADLKKPFKVGTASYWVTPLRYLPDFALDVKTGQAIARSENPNNPALLVEIQGDRGTERRWLLSRYPQLQMGKDPRLKLVFQWQPFKVKQFISDVRILEPTEVRRATVAVNHPLRHKGWTLYQTSYDPQEHRWSGFQVSKDPGVGIAYAGFFLLVTGVITMLGLGPLLRD